MPTPSFVASGFSGLLRACPLFIVFLCECFDRAVQRKNRLFLLPPVHWFLVSILLSCRLLPAFGAAFRRCACAQAL